MSNKKLGFGLMRLPQAGEGWNAPVDTELLCRMVDTFIERGFTYFDTALMYNGGQSEAAAKTCLVDRHPRESYTLATKLHYGFFNSLEDRDTVFDGQLAKCGVTYFDYYLLHDINSHSIDKFNSLDCFSWIQEKKAQGKARHIGFSFHGGPELLDEVLTAHPEMEFVQLQLNYLDWDSIGVQSRKCYEVAVKHGKPVIVMEPVKGGTLAKVPEPVETLFKTANPDASVPSWAIRFAASLDNVMVVLSGMSNLEQVLDNTTYMQDLQPITEAERAVIAQAVDAINANIAVPCTGCDYCAEGCPMNIPISRYFSLYNADKQEIKEKGWTPQSTYYDNLTKTHGKASDCVACGQCEGVCPQHLPIIEHLQSVAAHFER